MKHTIAFLLLLVVDLLAAYSQTVITGTVSDKQKEPVPFVTVTMQAKGESTIAGFASTDEAGRYRLTFDGTADSLTVTVRGMMIETTMRSAQPLHNPRLHCGRESQPVERSKGDGYPRPTE